MIVIKRQFSCFIAYLLLLIFSVTQFAGVLHHHVDEQKHGQVSVLKKNTSSTDIIKLVSACKLCRDLTHMQLHYFDAAIEAYAYTPENAIISYQAGAAQQLFDTAVNQWTNKGPPSSPSSLS